MNEIFSGSRSRPGIHRSRREPLDPPEPERALPGRAGDDPAAERRVLPRLWLVTQHPAANPERGFERRPSDASPEGREPARLVQLVHRGHPFEVDRRAQEDRRRPAARNPPARGHRRRSCRRHTARRALRRRGRSPAARGPPRACSAGRSRRGPARAGRSAGRPNRRGSGPEHDGRGPPAPPRPGDWPAGGRRERPRPRRRGERSAWGGPARRAPRDGRLPRAGRSA